MYFNSHFVRTNNENPPNNFAAISLFALYINFLGKTAIFDFNVFLGKSKEPAV